MAEIRVNPTRMELKKLRTRYDTARRGHKLLKDKRDELMRRFLDVVREDKELRERVEEKLSKVYGSFSSANAVTSPKILTESLIVPKREGQLSVDYKNVMSVIVPVFDFQILSEGGSDSYNYGFAFTSSGLDSSLRELNSILPDLVKLAELEKTAGLLAEEIEKTRRRVNALEHIMMPQYLTAIKSIKMKLDENERGNITRLMKVKDMMIEEQQKNRRADDYGEEE